MHNSGSGPLLLTPLCIFVSIYFINDFGTHVRPISHYPEIIIQKDSSHGCRKKQRGTMTDKRKFIGKRQPTMFFPHVFRAYLILFVPLIESTAKSSTGVRGGLFGAGGRFQGGTDPIMEKFNESLSFDKRLWAQDIRGSMAYAKGLAMIGIITDDERDQLIQGLEQVHQEWEQGVFVEKPGDEDIHTANERRLTEIIGKEVGGKLHTGRSRNDQVATDTRLWTVQAEHDILHSLSLLLQIGANHAQEHIDLLTAGYTHLQPAQPIRYSHWLCSHLVPLVRDAQRLQQLIPRANVCPLGSGALAGNAFGIDREFLAQDLAFDGGVTWNSLDSVCDRDFVVEFLYWSTLFLTHLSQFAEDVIVTNLLQGVVIDDAYATGSSLMPQKKNPDALELLRGKVGFALGRAVGLTTTLKGLPRAYNKDLQEDKVPLFETVDTVQDCLALLQV